MTSLKIFNIRNYTSNILPKPNKFNCNKILKESRTLQRPLFLMTIIILNLENIHSTITSRPLRIPPPKIFHFCHMLKTVLTFIVQTSI